MKQASYYAEASKDKTSKSTQTTLVTRPDIAVAISVALRLKINWSIEPVGWLSSLYDVGRKRELNLETTKGAKYTKRETTVLLEGTVN